MYRVVLLLVVMPFLTFVLSANSHAEKIVDIFSTSALVVNQSPEVRRQAAAKGLERVLIRLSGKRDIGQVPALKPALRKAVDYLDRFSYQSTSQTLTIAGASQKATLLLMQFNLVSVKQLLTESGSPIWSESRPDVLVWTATDIRGKKYVDIESSMAKELNNEAKNRGLPIVIPVLDLEDRGALPVARLWALDDDRVRLASKRYGTNAVLSGRFTYSRNSWGGNFILMHNGKTTYLSVKGKSEAAVAASIVDQVSDYFATLYAVTLNTVALNGSSNDTLTKSNGVKSVSGVAAPPLNPALERSRGPRSLYLQVNNIDDFAKYVVVMNYLETLALVSSVHIANATRPELLLDMQLAVDRDQFFSALELDNRLRQITQSGSRSLERFGDKYSRPLEFVWR